VIEGSRQNAHQDLNSDVDARLGTRIHHFSHSPPHALLNGPVSCERATFSSLPSTHISQTAGYDGSMMNGLNILPSYTDYFVLNPATTGLNTASIFIGGFFGPLVSGVISDRIGRRPAIFWGSVITLVGVLLQTATQDIAMFVVARIVLGFGAALSGIAGGVYLSETFPSQWRAWGVGMLNNFY
jgi:MFS family permease